MSKTITIYNFPTNFEAEQAKQRLEKEGVNCFLTNELTYMTDQNPYVEGVELRIKSEDAEVAIQLLAEMGYQKQVRKVPGWYKQLDKDLTLFAFMRPWPLELKTIALLGVISLIVVGLIFLFSS